MRRKGTLNWQKPKNYRLIKIDFDNSTREDSYSIENQRSKKPLPKRK